MSYATIADLKAASGDDSIADDDATALWLLNAADAKIDEYCGQSFPTTEGGTVPAIVVVVAATVASRGWLNPSGAQSKVDTAGPSSLTTNWGSGSTPTVPLALRTSEKDDLARYKIRRSGIGTIATERPIAVSQEIYVGVVGGDKPFPWPDADAM